jgi:hypothetical protein
MSLHSPHVIRKYGFLYVGFEPGSYYQESIYMMRKVVFILCAKVNVGQQVSPSFRTLLLLLLTCINLALHLVSSPFDNRAYFGLDWLETYCDFTLILLLTGRLCLVLLLTNSVIENVIPGSSLRLGDFCPSPDDHYNSMVVRIVYAPAIVLIVVVLVRAGYLMLRSSIWPVDGPPMLPNRVLKLMPERLELSLVPPNAEALEQIREVEHVALSHDLKSVASSRSLHKHILPERERLMLKAICAEAVEVLLQRHELCVGGTPSPICVPTFLIQFERIIVGCACQALRSRLKARRRQNDRESCRDFLKGVWSDVVDYGRSIAKSADPDNPELKRSASAATLRKVNSDGERNLIQQHLSVEELHVALLTLTPRLLDRHTLSSSNMLRNLCENSSDILGMLQDHTHLFHENIHEHRGGPMRAPKSGLSSAHDTSGSSRELEQELVDEVATALTDLGKRDWGLDESINGSHTNRQQDQEPVAFPMTLGDTACTWSPDTTIRI